MDVSEGDVFVPGWNGNSGNSKLGESNAAEKLRLLLAIVRCCIADAIRPTPLHAMILEYYLLKDLLQQRYRKLR